MWHGIVKWYNVMDEWFNYGGVERFGIMFLIIEDRFLRRSGTRGIIDVSEVEEDEDLEVEPERNEISKRAASYTG